MSLTKHYMSHPTDHGSNNLALGALGIAVAAAIGAGLGLAFAPQKGEKTRDDIRKKAEALASGFKQKREDVQKTLTEMFGNVSDDLEQAYVEIRGNILAGLDDLKAKKKATQANFEKLVDDVVDEAAKSGKWAKDKVKAMTDKVKGEWEDFKADLA